MIWIFTWLEMQQHAMAWYHYEEEFFYKHDIMRFFLINICNTDSIIEPKAWPWLTPSFTKYKKIRKDFFL